MSEAPTKPPRARMAPPRFDVSMVFRGSAGIPSAGESAGEAERVEGRPFGLELDEKARQAYFWIVNNAIISPAYDIEFNRENRAPKTVDFQGAGATLTLPTDQSYSSFVLLPLLSFLARKRALFVGGPGRGKTASAILMGLLAGYEMRDLRRSILHGQPQLTVADMLGNPLPRDLLSAERTEDIRIAWRRWLDMRVKIVDEYNRIPTRTQSALLTLVADGYAEILDQVFECPDSAWFLTANDDLGGGTYQVIEALKDRIDVVVRTLNLNCRFTEELLFRIESGVKPEDVLPPEIIFTERELDAIHEQINAMEVPRPVRRRLEFFTAQFEFCDLASPVMEYKSKDYVRLADSSISQVCKRDCGRDKLKALCSQTENGISVRAKLALLSFAKALAWFRGKDEVGLDDVRQVVPWILHEKLKPNEISPFFAQPENLGYMLDKVAWLRHLFDLAMEEYERLDLDNNDPVAPIAEQFSLGLEGLEADVVRRRMAEIEVVLKRLSSKTKLLNHVHDDVLALKYYWMRYANYLAWLEWRN